MRVGPVSPLRIIDLRLLGRLLYPMVSGENPHRNQRPDLMMIRPSAPSVPPYVLIIEPDHSAAQRMVKVLGAGERGAERPSLPADSTPRPSTPFTECVIIGSLSELFEQDLDAAQLVICAVYLPDGTGLNVLDFLRGRFPLLPVILIGSPEDSAVAVEAIRAGAVDFLTATNDMLALPLVVEKCLAHRRVKDQNERLQRDLSDSLTELAVKNHQLQALVRQLEATARTDDLTGLCNRRSLTELLERAWRQAVRNNRPLAFMMIDLDDFKMVNDGHGHQCGDEILREAGRIIRANCRQVDMPARYGGDEFCVLMPESESHETGQVARRILCEWARANAARLPGEPRITMSIGVAQIDASRPVNSEELIRHADEALYAAKASGKGCIMVRGRDGIHPVQSPPGDVGTSRGIAVRW